MYTDSQAVDEKLKELEEIGDPELVPNLLNLYFEVIEDKKNQLITGLKEKKFDKIYSVSHSLKSTCGNLGSQILFKKLVDLEQKTKNNTDLNTVPEVETLLNIVVSEMDLFSAYLSDKRTQLAG